MPLATPGCRLIASPVVFPCQTNKTAIGVQRSKHVVRTLSDTPQEGRVKEQQGARTLCHGGRGLAATRPGEVHLVGTGPGDPELLTMKAVRLMAAADVVLYDRLVSTDILKLVNSSARMLYVGKAKGLHTRTQDEIHTLLQSFAEDGYTVLRLKGGDPFIYGRGGEEALYLRERGITVRVTPGITAAAGICAELGIPLTHRSVATSVRYLTGHAREGGGEELGEQVRASVDARTTLVIYMGLGLLEALIEALSAAGLVASTPAVAVERGTTPDQRTVFSTLGSLTREVQKAALRSPTLLIFGNVVALSPDWPAASRTDHDRNTEPASDTRGVFIRSQSPNILLAEHTV